MKIGQIIKDLLGGLKRYIILHKTLAKILFQSIIFKFCSVEYDFFIAKVLFNYYYFLFLCITFCKKKLVKVSTLFLFASDNNKYKTKNCILLIITITREPLDNDLAQMVLFEIILTFYI